MKTQNVQKTHPLVIIAMVAAGALIVGGLAFIAYTLITNPPLHRIACL